MLQVNFFLNFCAYMGVDPFHNFFFVQIKVTVIVFPASNNEGLVFRNEIVQ